MRKDAVYRMRGPKKTLAAIKRVAATRGEDASAWGLDIIEAQLRLDLAALQLRDQLQAARPGRLTEDEAGDLVDEARRATKPMRPWTQPKAGGRAMKEPSHDSLRDIPEVDFASAKVRRNPYASRSSSWPPTHVRRGLDASSQKRRPSK